jgi:SPP1 family predicted phage head-tail adaptor
MPSLRIGEKRERVRIERVTGTATDTGGIGPPWTTTIVATVLAAIESLTGQEAIALGGQQATLTHRIRIDYLPGIKPADRVVETASLARTFEIIGPAQHDPVKRETTLSCIEKVA